MVNVNLYTYEKFCRNTAKIAEISFVFMTLYRNMLIILPYCENIDSKKILRTTFRTKNDHFIYLIYDIVTISEISI